jgi:hypothetical protein
VSLGLKTGKTPPHDFQKSQKRADLRNDVCAPFKRMDLILTRGGITATAAKLVNDKPSSRTSSGLWPSDHAGVVATLQIQA